MTVCPRSRAARSSWRAGARAAAGLLLALAGCDHFRVESFHGSKILLTIAGAAPTAAGHHVELWARESTGPADQRVERLLASAGDRRPDGSPCGAGESCPRAAYSISYAIPFERDDLGFRLTDGCMIDDAGNLLWQPAANPDGQGPQGPSGAAAVLRRIHQLTDLAPLAPLLVLVAHDDHAAMRPRPDESQSPAARLAACRAYWDASPFGYDGNPFQLTAPRHGALYGALDFLSLDPPQILGGIALVSDYGLHDLQEIWLTDTEASVSRLDPAQVDCSGPRAGICRGTVLLDGARAADSGRGVYHFELASPSSPGPSGSASVQVRLDEDPQPL